MTTDAKYNAEQINTRLAGGTIENAAITPDEDDYDQRFGLVINVNGERLIAWVDCDAESNGPGWLAIEDAA